jgi:hypothetical protein
MYICTGRGPKPTFLSLFFFCVFVVWPAGRRMVLSVTVECHHFILAVLATFILKKVTGSHEADLDTVRT